MKTARYVTIRLYAGAVDDAGNYPFVEIHSSAELSISTDGETHWIGPANDPEAECLTVKWEYNKPEEPLPVIPNVQSKKGQ